MYVNVCPTDTVLVVGVNTILSNVKLTTSTAAVPLVVPRLALTVVLPTAIAVAFPASTLKPTTALSADDHST